MNIESVESTEAQGLGAEPERPRVFSSMDLERIVEQCDFFERQHNFWGAISTLRKTLEVLPDQPELLYRLAKLEHQFRDNRGCTSVRASRADSTTTKRGLSSAGGRVGGPELVAELIEKRL